MTDDGVRIRVKMGNFEVEYEGPESLLPTDLTAFVHQVLDLRDEGGPSASAEKASIREDDADSGASTALVDMSIASVAGRLNVSSGPGLVIAAAAHLTLCEGKETLARKDLLDRMKEATGYYKDTMSKNLSHSLKTLLRQQRLNQSAEGRFALAIKEKHDLHATLTNDG